ncbi:hypothetical protein INT45_011084 [Circinella minor]|uniref:SigF-like NTF2-like domain-containing protein n=1 Tax=Circinella minor TaxID=1195481 RepID=A0A8H7VR47_9FUNG|nr:hypothetical protein INT45_011084 [Circinella minor]
MDLECGPKYNDTYDELIAKVVEDLFSFNDTRQKRILDHYYFHDATFDSPLLATDGVYNIRHVLLLWKALNKYPPTVKNVCFNGQTCVVYLTQKLCPRLFPFVQLELPVIATLNFQETDVDSGLLKINHHQESWTLEGLLQAVPVLSYWYDNVVRVLMGKMISSTGEVVYSATERMHLLAPPNNNSSSTIDETSSSPSSGISSSASSISSSFQEMNINLHKGMIRENWQK